MPQVSVFSPAKVNLHLAIGPKRDDGYHEAVSIMHALTLHDIVTVRQTQDPFEVTPGQGLTLQVTCMTSADVAPLDIPQESNIAYKAVKRLSEALQRQEDETVTVSIHKSIPHAAGLGGGSSNAAAALVGVCSLWGVEPTDPRVIQVAQGLGADVPFFIYGGCARMVGVGDVMDGALVPSHRQLVLVRPDAGVSTAAAYREFDQDPCFISQDLAKRAAQAVCADELELFNNLAPASERVLPELAQVRQWLTEQEGVTGVLLSGSGSATFGLCQDSAAAFKAVASAKRRGWWARSCALSGASAKIMGEVRSGVSRNDLPTLLTARNSPVGTR